jgi:hypothetical protein
MMHALALSALVGALSIAQVTPDAGPSPEPSPAATQQAAPSPQPTQAYRFIYHPAPQAGTDPAPSSAPAILEIDLTDQVIVTPTELNVRVLTSPAVVSVTVQTLGHSIALPEVQPGLFGFKTTLGPAPGSLRNRSFDVVFVAADGGGHTASVTLPLTLK